MILAVVIIFLVAVYFITVRVSRDPDEARKPAITADFIDDPVHKYVTSCLEMTSRNALKHVGEHGGYANLERNNIFYTNDPTESDAVVLSDLSSSVSSNAASSQNPLFAVPYYWYMDSPNSCSRDCVFYFRMPSLQKESDYPSIEAELNYFIENNLDICINNFDDFKEQGYEIISLAPPRSSTSINEDGINNVLYYPLEIKHLDKTYRMEDYVVDHQINMNQILNLAEEVTLLQEEYRFLENMAVNLIDAYGSVDGPIPPTADSTFEFGNPGNVWIKSKVKDNVQEILAKYTYALRAVGTLNYVDIGQDPLGEKFYDYQLRITLNHTYDLELYFNYLRWWQIYFDLNCDGELCRPESFSNTYMILVGNQRYQFYYTMAFPVMVRIHDPSAFNGQGYDYYFFLESNVRYNEPLQPGDSPHPDVLIGGSSMICNENQRNSGEYVFSVVDDLTDELLEDLAVTYNCGQDSCPIEVMEDGEFKGKLPICAGGMLSLIKDKYMQKSMYVSTKLDKGEDLGEIRLEPLRARNIKINKIMFKKPSKDSEEWTIAGEGPLKPKQEATIILKKEKLPGEQEQMQVAFLSGDQDQQQLDDITSAAITRNITVVPGTYNVDVMLIDKNTIEIPEETRTMGALLISHDFTIPSIVFNESAPFLLGGLKGDFTITDDIDNTDTIVLNVAAFELGEIPADWRKLEDLEIMAQIENYTERYRSRLGFTYE